MGIPSVREVYEFGDFRLDAGHRMLYQRDEELTIAPKAVETLVALVERRGEIVSKEELLTVVWPDAVVEESNLFAYLSVLRKVLGTQKDGRPWVETRRRRGYRFSGDVRLIPAKNGGNGIPIRTPTPLRLVSPPPTFELPESISANPSNPSDSIRGRSVVMAIGLAVLIVAVILTYQYLVDRPIDSITVAPYASSNAEANNLYIKGRAYTLKLTRTEIDRGIEYLYQAVEKDPDFALAYAGIARAHLILGIASEAPPSEFIKAKDAAQKAIALNQSLAEGYSAMASVAFFYDRNFPEAERLYKRALELDPKSSTAHQQYADFLNKTGRKEEGAAEIAQAMKLDPSSVFINAFYAVSLPDKEALDQIRFAIDMGPHNYLVHLFAADIYARNGMYDESVAAFRRAKDLSPQQTLSDVGLVGALIRIGRTDEAQTVGDQMFSEAKRRFVPPAHLALVCKQLGDKETAFVYLEEGLEVRDPKMVFLNERPWSDYRNDPRFQDLKRRVGFTQ